MRNLLFLSMAVGVAALMAGCQNKPASVDNTAISDIKLADVKPIEANPTVNLGGTPGTTPPSFYTPSSTSGTQTPMTVVPPPATGTPPMNYTVAKGDSLYSISRRFYGDNTMAKAIFAANQQVLASPDIIKVGQSLYLPARGENVPAVSIAPTTTVTTVPRHTAPTLIATTPRTIAVAPPPPVNVRPTTYTVKKGDSLFIIAKRIYGKGSLWTKIYEANKSKIKNPDTVREGTVLTIPS